MNDSFKKKESLSLIKSLINKLKKLISPFSKNNIRTTLQELASNHELNEHTSSMLEGVLDVSIIKTRDIMVPRSEIAYVNKDTCINAIIQLATQTGHSRFPVFAENNHDVIGIILAKDLLSYSINPDKKFIIKDILRPAIFVPETKKLDTLLNKFRDMRHHMAIIVDEYGNVSGLVTIEDVLEQIVGEIEDEHDIEGTAMIKSHSDGSYSIKATIPVYEFNDFFNSNLPEDKFETIGGLISQKFGYLPKRNEETEISGFFFSVVKSDNRRIHLLQVINKNNQHATTAF